ncbi:hypothetical protein AAFC00_001422 [Neodothiora populina]|uniref:Uncharacterized protein n=1 Tax=Neodothiora populina TaxID=2781224 RepID=A0ABR3PNX0_9PEZI
MSTTPPRAMRLRTPPAPHHGPDYDNYEPYSPIRRSTRNSSLRTRQQSPTAESSSTARLSMTSTPRKTTLSRTMSSQTLSPPSSPEPAERHAEEPTSVRRTLFSSRKHLPLSASDNQDFKSSPAMLPTPTKTPSKQNATASMPTARILNFKPASLEDVMPSARRQRKSRLTLFEDDAPQAESISVFTDAQDRVPDMDPSEDNPFIGSRKREPKPTKKAMLAARDREAEMEEAVRNEEGLIYVFRGKRIFRPFASSSRDTSDHDSAASEQGQLKRKAGHGAHRPITRSAVKPRLLWPSKEQLHEDEPSHTAHDDDEEADTDIEQEHMPRPMPQADKDLVTPAKKMFAPVDMLTPLPLIEPRDLPLRSSRSCRSLTQSQKETRSRRLPHPLPLQ